MNKLQIIPLFIIIVALCTATALAAPGVTLNDINDDVDQKKTTTETLTINNTGDNNLSITSISISDLEYETYSLSATLSATSITEILVGNTQDITVSASATDNQELGTYTGTITVEYSNGTETNTETTSVSIEVTLGNHLIINKVKVEVDDESDTVNDGDKVSDEAHPRSTVIIEIRLENDFAKNMDIEDIEIEIDAENNDLDWFEDDEINRIKDGDKETITFEFEVPSSEDIDEDDYDIDIIITGTDEDGHTHGETWTIELEVEKNKYDLEFTSVSLSPSHVECDSTYARLNINIDNIGSRDIDEGTITINSIALKNEVILRDLEIDEDDDLSKTISLPLREGLSEGEYTIDLILYTSGNSNDDTDYDDVRLVILQCAKEVVEPKEETIIEVIRPTTPITPVTSGNVVHTATGTPSNKFIDTNSNTYLGLLVAIVILLVILIGIAVVSLGKKK